MAWDDDLEGAAYHVAVYDGSPLRVVAGPGTGKTFSLMRRIARFLENGVEPERVLVVTFTRTAAIDIEHELGRLNVSGVGEVDNRTLHSFCFRTLQQARVFDLTRRVARPLLDFEKRFLLEDLNNIEVFGDVSKRGKRIQAFEALWARQQGQALGLQDEVDRLFDQQLGLWLRFHRAMLLSELVPVTLNYLRNNPQSEAFPRYDIYLSLPN